MAVSSPTKVSAASARPPPAELDDLTLARAKRGEPIAARALVDRYAGPVFSMVRRMCPNASPQTHEDLSQDIFLKVFAALPEFEIAGPAKLSTWILTIATRRCIDSMRRRTPITAAVDDTALVAPDRSDVTVTVREQQSTIEQALLTLSEEHRTVIVLRMFGDASYRELADALGVDEGTVKSRLSRAKACLRAALSPEPT